MTGLIAVGANFAVDYLRADQDLSGLLTKAEFDAALASDAAAEALLRDREREVLRAELAESLAAAEAARIERLKEIEFQYSVLSQLVDETNERVRARLLLFYIRAGALRGLNEGALTQMAETSIRNTGGNPDAPMGVPSREAISTAEAATVRIQFSGSNGQTGYCTAVNLSPKYILAPSFCDNNYLGGSHPFSAALADNDAFVRLKNVWRDEVSALTVLEREVGEGTPVSLTWNSLRAPSIGEAVYFATWDLGSGEKTSLTCLITGFSNDQSGIAHDCETGAGTAGALILAVSDNAPVGVHLGQNEIGGYGASLGSLRDQLAQFF
ncbi:hypothetical protein GFB49_18590 [Epibacterium sp. SM1979]|uniref:Uncharacterized protein n=1 Tax=Tritonibacter litoralis TaxID=2662264 RepID=A0A843YH39_9RHOB|nr:hypothetical protein [Tritonibacter litoralis]MQQ10476.1 hypothetical protein [Tritonibacter litoralis]